MAAATAVQVLTGLADVLRRDDPQMPDPEQRAGKATLFDRVANDLLAAKGLDNQCLQAADEWDRQPLVPARDSPPPARLSGRHFQETSRAVGRVGEHPRDRPRRGIRSRRARSSCSCTLADACIAPALMPGLEQTRIRQHAPDDYARILQWFPLADLEVFRRNLA